MLSKLQQQTYMYLLQRYLEIKHNSKSESETRFLRLMNCVNELYAVSNNFGAITCESCRTFFRRSSTRAEEYESKRQSKTKTIDCYSTDTTDSNEYKELCEDDKIILLKTSCPEILCLYKVVNFDFDGEFWRVPITPTEDLHY
ncbi:unnamed protein product [Oppiella nova]|uniref:Nuclear receptor domain-containing protein n=1 Tax=Oppiella nova TaxID=334625 RepID=A0A7R9M5H3_9ACAR|nr:unnamed protein product [Oppiella nova]CAG2171011.1 unnamed protein product [Oppiella nova]